jgi:hypothetical protein
MTEAELEEREVAAELFELRRRVVLDQQSPEEVADDYERVLLETPAPSFAHWEALRRLRDALGREQDAERTRLLLHEMTRLTAASRNAAMAAALATVIAGLVAVAALVVAVAGLLAPS